MKSILSSFFVGLIFAIGLGLSGMTNPARVIGFLDVFGAWDPSLMFVMIGALAAHSILFRWIIKRKRPLFSDDFHLPKKKNIDGALVIGAILFGLGWGFAGYCPAPAITALMSFSAAPFIFVAAMMAGMILCRGTRYRF